MSEKIILEYLAVRQLKNSFQGPSLCLVGPPEVGKMSFSKSIMNILDINYIFSTN